MLHIATNNPYKAQITNAKNNNNIDNKLGVNALFPFWSLHFIFTTFSL